MRNSPFTVVVLISGNGSNLQSLINRKISDKETSYEIAAVISNKLNAYGLNRAKAANIPTLVIDHTRHSTREDFDAELIKEIDLLSPSLIVLAGFMRILTTPFVDHFKERLINIHPSLLPLYPGTNTHQRVLDAGDRQHGVSVHYVTDQLDGGPIIARASVRIDPQDDAKSLSEKVLANEHLLYPEVVNWFAQGRVRLEKHRVHLDNKILPPNGFTFEHAPKSI
jgi:phosphoribosylglycinamide formyltransferase-1